MSSKASMTFAIVSFARVGSALAYAAIRASRLSWVTPSNSPRISRFSSAPANSARWRSSASLALAATTAGSCWARGEAARNFVICSLLTPSTSGISFSSIARLGAGRSVAGLAAGSAASSEPVISSRARQEVFIFCEF